MKDARRAARAVSKSCLRFRRRRLRSIVNELEVPKGMAVIIRTAGQERNRAEIKRDLDYLLRLWEIIRDSTLKSVAPYLIYEEANLIKRSIRDLYRPDFEGILVQGDEGYRIAKGFMRTMMPSRAKLVQPYREKRAYLGSTRLKNSWSICMSRSWGSHPVVTL